MPNPRVANGHRRRELRKRLLAAGAYCTWGDCPWPTDWLGIAMATELGQYDPRFPVVDEIIPIAHGGSPYTRENTRLLHAFCNGQRGAGRPARSDTPTARPPITASPGWGSTA